MNHSEVVQVYEVGPIIVSDDREQDYTYRVEVLRGGDGAEYSLLVFNKQRYFVRRSPENSDASPNYADNAYQVKVRRDLEGIEEYHEFIWNKDKFVKQLKENPDDWQKKLIYAKDNTLLWEELRGSTGADVLHQFNNELVESFSSLEDEMTKLEYKEIVKTIDLKAINLSETNQYFQFRVEVVRDTSAHTPYVVRVYRRENYSLQPTFSIDGELAYDLADCWLWIEDEQNLLGTIQGSTVDEVIDKAVKARDELEARLRAGQITS